MWLCVFVPKLEFVVPHADSSEKGTNMQWRVGEVFGESKHREVNLVGELSGASNDDALMEFVISFLLAFE